MHLVIYFHGTGDFNSFGRGTHFVSDNRVKTIAVLGCEQDEVCNDPLMPNLTRFAKRFVTKLFAHENDSLQLANHPTKIKKIGIIHRYCMNFADFNTNDAVTGITLCGYSRGAVTCFNVAKQLNKIAPNVPVDIVANQPVPGNMHSGPGTNAASVIDCSRLYNLKNVCIILGAYNGEVDGGSFFQKKFHRAFFNQVCPKLPQSKLLKRKIILLPRVHHWQGGSSCPTGIEHLFMQVSQCLFNVGYIDQKTLDEKINEAKRSYTATWGCANVFPNTTTLQKIYGLKRKEVYQHRDSLFPAGKIANGMSFKNGESIIAWWKRHNKHSSFVVSKETKHLIAKIKVTDINNEASLLSLYQATDKWLLQKEGSGSMRCLQVAVLRDNIRYRLTKKFSVKLAELSNIRYKNLLDNQFLLKHWKKQSASASFFKTKATKELDQAFKAHASVEKRSKANDQQLLNALDDWLTKKEKSTSKRYALVTQKRDQLADAINGMYPNENWIEYRKSVS